MGESGDNVFIGEYHHNIDEKGRITIPVKVREELGQEFIITRGLDGCLFIYPNKEWEEIINKYKELPNIKDARNFLRFFLSGADKTSIDKQGRININIPLIKYAGLNKNCIIIGVNDHLEIWDEDKWQKLLIENETNFSEIADKLFSKEL